MYRQSSSRNHRSRRIRVRHVLQICLLFAVSLWLIYQVKHSHDQKKESEEIDAELDGESGGGFIRIGRKDIPKTITKSKDRFESAEDKETNEEEEEEVDEIKHEDEIQEDKKSEEDDTDELELEKLDAEVDREEDFIDDEKDVDEQDLGNEKREDNSDEADNDELKKGENPSNVTYGVTSENSTTPQELSGNLTRNSSLFSQNAIEIVSELDHGIHLEEVNNSTVDEGNNPLHPRSMGSADPSNSIEVSMEDEVLKSKKTKNTEQIKADSVVLTNSSNSMEEKMVRANLDTIPGVQQTEGNTPKGAVSQ